MKKIGNISFNNLDFLDKVIYSEKDLLVISNILLKEKEESKNVIIYNMIDKISLYGKKYDWNIASILQHIHSDLVITIFKNIPNLPRLYNSIGPSWLFGEYNRKDQFVVDYLHAVVNYI